MPVAFTYLSSTMLEIPAGQFDGYLFDFDGTLCDTMAVHYGSWEYALGKVEAGFLFDFTTFYSYAGTEVRKFFGILESLYGVSLDVETMLGLKKEYYMKHLDDLQIIGPVCDIAYQKKEEGVPVGIVTGGLREIVELSIDAVGLNDLCDVLVTFEEVEHGKPAPDMFFRTAELLNVAPEKCLVFEDGQLGIDGAHAAGMQTVFVSPELAPSWALQAERLS